MAVARDDHDVCCHPAWVVARSAPRPAQSFRPELSLRSSTRVARGPAGDYRRQCSRASPQTRLAQFGRQRSGPRPGRSDAGLCVVACTVLPPGSRWWTAPPPSPDVAAAAPLNTDRPPPAAPAPVPPEGPGDPHPVSTNRERSIRLHGLLGGRNQRAAASSPNPTSSTSTAPHQATACSTTSRARYLVASQHT